MACLVEIDVGIGVEDGEHGGVLEDSIGEDAMQVERDGDGQRGADELAGFFKQVAFAIFDVFRGEGTVEGEIDGV